MKKIVLILSILFSISCSQEEARKLYNKSIKLYEAENYQESSEALTQAISLSHDNMFLSDVYYNLGNCLYKMAFVQAEESDDNQQQQQQQQVDKEKLLSSLNSYKRAQELSLETDLIISQNAEIVRNLLKQISDQEQQQEEQNQNQEQNQDEKGSQQDDQSQSGEDSQQSQNEEDSQQSEQSQNGEQSEDENSDNSESASQSKEGDQQQAAEQALTEEEAKEINDALNLIDEEQLNKQQREIFRLENDGIQVEKDW